MSETVVIVKHVVRYETSRVCTTCDKALRKNWLVVRSSIVSQGGCGKRLSFPVGKFCSVRCLSRFAETKRKDDQATIRGWTLGENREKRAKRQARQNQKGGSS